MRFIFFSPIEEKNVIRYQVRDREALIRITREPNTTYTYIEQYVFDTPSPLILILSHFLIFNHYTVTPLHNNPLSRGGGGGGYKK